MEIQQLVLAVTELDVNNLARKHLPKDFPIENLEISILPEGLKMTGEVQVFMPVQFHALWELNVQAGKITARLESLRAMGVPVTVFRSMILKFVHEAAGKANWLSYENEFLIADLDKLAAKEGLSLRVNLQAIECQTGRLVVRSGI